MTRYERGATRAKPTCDRKDPLRSRKHAESVRKRMSDSGLRIYKCPAGNHWHLGRMTHK